MIRNKFFLINVFIFCFVLLISFNLYSAQGSFNVSTSNTRCYEYLWRLVGLGYVEPESLNERPYSMKRFVLAVDQAKKNRKKEDQEKTKYSYKKYSKIISRKHSADKLIKEIEYRCIVDTGGYWINTLNKMEVETTYAKGSELTITPNNGVGNINARTVPLLDYRGGEGEVDGFYASAEVKALGQLSDHFYYLAQPILFIENPREQDAYAGVHLKYGYGVVTFGNFALELGRDELVFGPGENGGLIFSGNARGLDGIRISNPIPARLPWYFKYLGKWQLTMFGANMGPGYTPKYAWIAGFALSLMPVKWVELSLNHAVVMGGENTNLSALDIFGEFWGFRPVGTDPGSENKSNHLMEASLLFRVPWRALEFYGVLTNEDKRDTIKRFFKDGSAWLLGMHFPALTNTSSLRIEYTRTSAIQYRHGGNIDGFTLNNRILGSDLGPDAHGVRTAFIQDFPGVFGYKVNLDWDYRRSDMHATQIEADGTFGDIIVSQSRPADQRLRLKTDLWFDLNKNITVGVVAGYEHVWSCQYVGGKECNDFLLGAGIKFNFVDKFKIGG